MSDYLPLLLKELQETQPGLTGDLLSECVATLTKLEKAALIFKTTKNRSAEIILTNSYLESSSSHFDIWVAEIYEEVIDTINFSTTEILSNL
ncbi:hypothetical protein [Nostoc sp. UHCC 0252]|uniref:hypothetical protein n=1 Tax=Nostoc sp. UHCC 0252 TaxID=3110241 RepID=UPI002B211E82|nr:hypothetical protein [Nostoc sp. UHCC 0252]MEA5603694.1 hypothetical protein [Nostoc sp. UHCC 0252]